MPDAKWDVDDFDLSPDGKRIAYTFNENGTSTLHMVEIAGAKGAVTAKPVKDPTFNPPLERARDHGACAGITIRSRPCSPLT